MIHKKATWTGEGGVSRISSAGARNSRSLRFIPQVLPGVLNRASAREANSLPADRGQTMGDDDDRPILDDAAHVALNDALALIVERRGRLVENENARIGRERARAMAMRCLCPPERLAPRS